MLFRSKTLSTGSIRCAVQVSGRPLLLSIHTAFIKAFPVVDIQNAELLILFGRICGAIKQLPTSVVLSGDLTKRDDTPVAPGGMMDVWHGEHEGVQVAIKSFRSSSEHTLDEATEVRIKCAREVPS